MPNARLAVWLGLAAVLANLLIEWVTILPLLLDVSPAGMDVDGVAEPILTWEYMFNLSVQQIIVFGFCVAFGVFLRQPRKRPTRMRARPALVRYEEYDADG
jgi:hypothetical protein